MLEVVDLDDLAAQAVGVFEMVDVGLGDDALGERDGAALLITPGPSRDRLTAGAYIPRDENDVIGRLEFAMEAVMKAETIEAKMRKATKDG
ncbi:MAG: acyl-CoA dehydrogenase domain-containing protein, partial [Usitatibacter sp.]